MSFIGCAGSEDPGPNYDLVSHNHGKRPKIVTEVSVKRTEVVMRESLRAAAPGAAGRENPVPGVPQKKDQPSEDIRQQKPLVRLRQNEPTYHEADEGGPGSGRRPGGGSGGGGKKGGEGQHVTIGEGSGIHSGKSGTVLSWNHPEAQDAKNDYPFVGGRTPQGMGWVPVKLDSGEVTAMPKNRLAPSGQGGGGGVPEQHQKKIQQQDERMPDAMRDVMSPPKNPKAVTALKRGIKKGSEYSEAVRWPRRRSLRRKPIQVGT